MQNTVHGETAPVFANTNFVLQCQPMRSWLNGDDVIIVNDGIGMDIASLLQHGNRYKDNLNNTDPAALCERSNASGADIVLVAMGNTIQEDWIRQHMGKLNAQLFVSVGALFDFMSDGVQRAPKWVQKIRFEWLFRLTREPRRMAQRYTLDIARFLFLCISYPRSAINPQPQRAPTR